MVGGGKRVIGGRWCSSGINPSFPFPLSGAAVFSGGNRGGKDEGQIPIKSSSVGRVVCGYNDLLAHLPQRWWAMNFDGNEEGALCSFPLIGDTHDHSSL